MVSQNPHDVFEEITPLWTTKAILVASLREGLTRKSSTKNVMSRDHWQFHYPNISDRSQPKIPLIDLSEILVNLASEYTNMA
jgi:hypothetical protein